MPKPRDYDSKRVARYYTAMINDSVYQKVCGLDVTCYQSKEPLPWKDRLSGKKMKLSVGDPWGTWYECAWFCFTADLKTLPEGTSLAVLIDVEGELLITDQDGNPVRSLTSVGCRTPKMEYGLDERAIKENKLELWADGGSNDLFRKQEKRAHLRRADLVMVNEKAKRLYYDNLVISNLLEILPQDSARYAQIKKAYLDCAHLVVDQGLRAFDQATILLEKQLNMKNGDYPLNITAIGHGHLDLAWLWPKREAMRKAARTLASAVYLTEKYPGYVFGVSQPQMLEWIKEQHPDLYEKIKEAVREGRIEPQGAMWVEADTNLPSGESLIRQIHYGQTFLKNEFDLDMDYLWLPDVFGYTAALPQILKKSGVRAFFTQKISWNSINPFPHQSFIWKGPDGSSVLAHFFPENTYNGGATPKSAQTIEKNYIDKDVSSHALMVFGDGDGGGGPGEAHLEYLKRMENLLGVPPVKPGSVTDFIKEWEKDALQFQVWQGELYLEFHHGTYTTLGRSKRYNRKTEFALRDLELKAALASYTGMMEYPRELLDRLWKTMLFNQFHDVVPGSSIKRVYDESWEEYEWIAREINTIDQTISQKAVEFLGLLEEQWMVRNNLSWDRDEYVCIEGKVAKVTVPSMGYAVIHKNDLFDINNEELTAQEDMIDNGILRVKFDRWGAISSITDVLSHTEMIPEGQKGNELIVYRDIGDAWDFIPSYREFSPRPVTLVDKRFYVEGIRAWAEFTYRYDHSVIKQKVSLEKGNCLLRFDTTADWRNKETMLRTSFAHGLSVENAVCDIQFGNIKRPVTSNTSWEMAKDEIPAHKWVDVSDGGRGMAIINDCKYGYSAKDNRLSLNLIRSAEYGGCKFLYGDTPEGEYNHDFTDQCTHEFSYAVYWHKGDFQNSDLVKKAYEFNVPVSVYKGIKNKVEKRNKLCQKSFFTLNTDDVIIETVKEAYDGTGLIIRMYEYKGRQVHCSLQVNLPYRRSVETDLQEKSERAVELHQLSFTPYEIKTIKIEGDM